LTTPTYINGQNPLQTGLFCNSYPCTDNQLTFKDTTPCDATDYNTEYEVTDSSYNIYTQSTETQTALLCPAYGDDSPYAIFNVGSQKYYTNPIIEKYPFVDQSLIRHKIGVRSCEREYTIAVIGADDCWEEYMVLAVINQYDNFFSGNEYIIWVVTRDAKPDWSTYQKAYEDIERSGLSPNYLVSVDHSLELTPSIPTAPLIQTSVEVPTTIGDINSVIQETSVSTSSTRSIVGDSSVTSSYTSTSTTSTVIIEKSSDFSSLYELGQFDLYNSIQVIKSLDKQTIRRALSGKYYMTQATPCSLYNSPNSRVGMINTCFPASGMQLCFDDTSIDEWDCNSPRMVMDRGYNMRNGELQLTRSYITSVYPDDHPFSSSTYSLFTEGYYEEPIDETERLPLDGMICVQPSDMYKHQIILNIIGLKEDDYLIFCIANRYNNPLFSLEPVNQVIAYTRDRIPSQETMKSITQDLLQCGFNPNHLIKIDQTMDIDGDYVFDSSYYESQTSCWSISSSSCSGSMTSTTFSSSSMSSSVSISCD
jgi:lipocalin